ncbi:hypothetical protein J3459_014022 [Metarhizium acridum]|nr:hypothetical protein J3459_014022 [Metarhizium acridum]
MANAACVPTVLGEVTDRSNQSKAFTYLPVIYSLGSITGPALGGILVNKMGSEYPYLGPNILGAAMLAAKRSRGWNLVRGDTRRVWQEPLEAGLDQPSYRVDRWFR